MWVNSLFCKHSWSITKKYEFNDLLDTIAIERCEKCQKERGVHTYRKNIFGPPVYRSEMKKNEAEKEIARIQELYTMFPERDWTPMKKDL